MRDTKLRQALEDLDVIASAEFPSIGTDWRKLRHNKPSQLHQEAIAYTFRVDAKIDALLEHLGLEYIARPQPIIQKIKKEAK